jgi:hypothetical protein
MVVIMPRGEAVKERYAQCGSLVVLTEAAEAGGCREGSDSNWAGSRGITSLFVRTSVCFAFFGRPVFSTGTRQLEGDVEQAAKVESIRAENTALVLMLRYSAYVTCPSVNCTSSIYSSAFPLIESMPTLLLTLHPTLVTK